MSQKLIKKIAVSAAIGTGIGMFSTSVLIFLMAAAITLADVPAMLISPITVIFLAFGSLCGGFASAKLSGEKGLLCGCLSGILFFVFLWIFGTFFEEPGFGVSAIIKLMMIIISGSFGGILGVNYKRK